MVNNTSAVSAVCVGISVFIDLIDFDEKEREDLQNEWGCIDTKIRECIHISAGDTHFAICPSHDLVTSIMGFNLQLLNIADNTKPKNSKDRAAITIISSTLNWLYQILQKERLNNNGV